MPALEARGRPLAANCHAAARSCSNTPAPVRALVQTSARMEPTEPLPGKRARKPVNYRDMEDDLDEAIRESTKPKKSPKKSGEGTRRRAPVIPTFDEPDLIDVLGLEEDEDLDALTADQLRAEIDKVKTQITQLEEDLQKDAPVRTAGPLACGWI